MNSILDSLNSGFQNLLKNPNQALGLAVGIQGAINGTPQKVSNQTAQNNTASASGNLAKSSAWYANPAVLIGGGLAVVLGVVLVLKK